MTTAADIIARSARALGFLGDNEVLSATKVNQGLEMFNAMLDSWSASESLMAYVTVQQSFPLVIGQQTYTIGSGGNINTTRPQEILQAFVRDGNNLDYPMSIIPLDVWNNIGQKNITSQIPTTLMYYTAFPLGVINIFPIPLVAYTVFYVSTLDQVGASLITTTISMPNGYERAYVFNLAMEMIANGWPCLLDQKQLAALTYAAAESKGNVKRGNLTEVLASYDEAIISKSYATYNIYSDGNPRN